MKYPKWQNSIGIFFMVVIGISFIFGFSVSLIYDHRPPHCDICGIHAENQKDIYWLCDRHSSEVGVVARKQLGIAYSIKDCDYIETNMDVLSVELEIIRGRIQ